MDWESQESEWRWTNWISIRMESQKDAKKRDSPEEVPETGSQCLEIIENIAIQEVSNLDTGIISNAVEQNNKIQNISKEEYLTEYANANEENCNDIEKCNIFKVDHSKWGKQNAVYVRNPWLRMDFESGNQLFLSRNIFYGISMLIVRSGHSKKLE